MSESEENVRHEESARYECKSCSTNDRLRERVRALEIKDGVHLDVLLEIKEDVSKLMADRAKLLGALSVLSVIGMILVWVFEKVLDKALK